MSRRWNTATGMLLAVMAGSAWSAHPLQTEDTGTQGAGNIEWENGLSWSHAGDSKSFVYQPQLSYGLLPAVDLIVQPSWLRSRDALGSTVHGLGDTNVDAKWRFFGAAPISLAVRAGLAVATGDRGLGEPHGKLAAHVLAVATFDVAPFTFHGNAGWRENPNDGGDRSHIRQVSGAIMWAANEQLTMTVDAGLQSNPDPHRDTWPGYALLGAICTIRPGLDADVGYQKSVHTAPNAPSNRTLLLGLTYRFSL